MRKFIEVTFMLVVVVAAGKGVYDYLERNVTSPVSKINKSLKMKVNGKSF